MNFFAQQDRAKRKTFWLLVLLVAAVVCLIAMTVLATAAVLYFAQSGGTTTASMSLSWWDHLQHVLASDVLFYAAGAVLMVVTGGSLYKTLQLGGSGQKVAEALGGHRLEPNSSDPAERKVLNVVEEMAIASGNPVPPVFVLEDRSINAFAAGSDRRSAVIGITRGCINLLSREELQGVIAHEFSHIHFGDMRINLRLVAALHGILLIGLIGSMLLRSSMFGGRNRNRGAQVWLGLAFLVLGYSGIFFGALIKAAVSRQREFLADASAVQFTRNPDGISNALKKIGGLSNHALLSAPVATEYSHLYFAQGVKTAFAGLMATHPPLQERIKKIQPNWDGHFIVPEPTTSSEPSVAEHTQNKSASASAAAFAMSDSVEQIGNPTPANIATAAALLDGIPQVLLDAARDPFSARALIYSLLVTRDSGRPEQAQVETLRNAAHPATFKAFQAHLKQIQSLPHGQHLPLVDLAMPALKSQSHRQYQVFKKNLIALIKADRQVSLFEWCLFRIVVSNCEERPPVKQVKLQQASHAVETVLASACYSGKTRDPVAAFAAAQRHLPNLQLEPSSGAQISFRQLDEAVDQLAGLKPLEKPALLKALAACIQADERITAAEAELFRALGDCLDCPVPLLAGDDAP